MGLSCRLKQELSQLLLHKYADKNKKLASTSYSTELYCTTLSIDCDKLTSNLIVIVRYTSYEMLNSESSKLIDCIILIFFI